MFKIIIKCFLFILKLMLIKWRFKIIINNVNWYDDFFKVLYIFKLFLFKIR